MRRLVMILALAAGGCATERAHTRAKEAPMPEYRIGREDVIEVVGWKEPERWRGGGARGARGGKEVGGVRWGRGGRAGGRWARWAPRSCSPPRRRRRAWWVSPSRASPSKAHTTRTSSTTAMPRRSSAALRRTWV